MRSAQDIEYKRHYIEKKITIAKKTCSQSIKTNNKPPRNNINERKSRTFSRIKCKNALLQPG